MAAGTVTTDELRGVIGVIVVILLVLVLVLTGRL